MSRALITEGYLTDIADAIRAKSGSSDTYTPPQMAAAIQAIPTGITPTGTLNIMQNGTYDVTQYASANVNIPSGGSGRSDILNLYTFTSAGGGGITLNVRNGLLSIHRDDNYNWHLCTNAIVPAYATKLYVTVEAARRGTSYERWLHIGRYESSLQDEFVEIAKLVDNRETVSDILAQPNLISLNITQNDDLPMQTVVLDISDISTPFHVGVFSDYMSVYLYNIYCE